MNLLLSNVVDKGILGKERIILKVLIDMDIGRYAIFRTGKNANGITSKVHNAYWFPDKAVRAGDLIILYTNSGTSTSKINPDNSQYHFFYWGLTTALWDSDSGLVIASIPEWKAY